MDPMAGPRRTTGRFRSRSTPGDTCVQLARALPSLRAAAALVSTVVSHPPLSPPSSFPSAASFVALPPLCNHWRILTASVFGTYPPRAAARSRAALTPRHLPPLSSPLPPLPATPPSSYAPSFAELRMLLVHGQELDVLLHSQQPNALHHQSWMDLQRNGFPNILLFLHQALRPHGPKTPAPPSAPRHARPARCPFRPRLAST